MSDTVSHCYDFRTRNNLKRGNPKPKAAPKPPAPKGKK